MRAVNWTRVVATGALLVLLSGCISVQAIRESEGYRSMAIAHLSEGDTAGAITNARKATRKNKWDSEAWHTLGLAYFATDLYPDAEAAFLKALKLRSDYSQARLNLGGLYLQMERWDDAIKNLELVVADPEYRQPARALHNLGWAHFNRGDYKAARVSFNKVLRDFRGFCPALLNLGLVDEAEGKISDALGRYKQALQCDEGDLKARFNLGVAEARLDMVADACEHLSTVANADPYGEFHERATEYLTMLDCEQLSKL